MKYQLDRETEKELRKCASCDKYYIPTVSKKFCRKCWEEVQAMVR